MGATSPRTHEQPDADRTAEFGVPHAGDETAPRQLVAAPVSDRCTNCGASLASDQRYCVNCGERRGKPRFAFGPRAQQTVETTTEVVERGPRRPRPSSGSTLVAGIGTLLLAMGVGVLIGRENTNNSNNRVAGTPPVQVVTVGGGGGTGTGAAQAPTSTNTTPSSSSTHGKSSKTGAVKKVVVTKQVAAKATQAANHVLGGGQNLAPSTVTTGQSCSTTQAGCQGGQFTGNFFGQ
jgi:hypothetical protein